MPPRRPRSPTVVCVACDHEEIFEAVGRFGGRAVMTDPNAPSGTDRVAEVARQLDGTEVIVNVQGDEPDLAGESIDLVIRLLEEQPSAVMSTLATPIRSREQLFDPAMREGGFRRPGASHVFQPQCHPTST